MDNNNNAKWYSGPFIERLENDLKRLCSQKGFLNNEMYEVEELHDCWRKSAPEYMVNAVPEIPHYPTVAIAWAAYYGLGVAALWDQDWESASKIEDIYIKFREVRGWDCMDDYIMEDVLKIKTENPTRAAELTTLLQDCADIALTLINKEGIEPQSVEAFHMFAKTTETFFKLGVSLWLYYKNYKYQKIDLNLN